MSPTCSQAHRRLSHLRRGLDQLLVLQMWCSCLPEKPGKALSFRNPYPAMPIHELLQFLRSISAHFIHAFSLPLNPKGIINRHQPPSSITCGVFISIQRPPWTRLTFLVALNAELSDFRWDYKRYRRVLRAITVRFWRMSSPVLDRQAMLAEFIPIWES